jgi:hypothetical protein
MTDRHQHPHLRETKPRPKPQHPIMPKLPECDRCLLFGDYTAQLDVLALVASESNEFGVAVIGENSKLIFCHCNCTTLVHRNHSNIYAMR